MTTESWKAKRTKGHAAPLTAVVFVCKALTFVFLTWVRCTCALKRYSLYYSVICKYHITCLMWSHMCNITFTVLTILSVQFSEYAHGCTTIAMTHFQNFPSSPTETLCPLKNFPIFPPPNLYYTFCLCEFACSRYLP